MADPVEGPRTSTGPKPAGVDPDEIAAPGGAVVGEPGTAPTPPGDADVGGDADLGEAAPSRPRPGIDAADEAD